MEIKSLDSFKHLEALPKGANAFEKTLDRKWFMQKQNFNKLTKVKS